MNRITALAICAPLVLIGAAYPDYKQEASVGLPDPVAGPVTYRPCRPGRGDDRCIQLYERGVRASYARWLRDRGAGEERTQVAAVGGPDEPAPRPRRHRSAARHSDPAPAARDEHRCHEPDRHHGDARGM